MRRLSCPAFHLLPALALLVGLLALPSPGSAAELHLQARIDCAWALEEVRWAQRIWPADNPGPKPALAELLERETVAAQVTDSLRMQTALSARYGLQLERAQLQRELQRMVEHTQAPQQLQRLFDALQNDPLRVQECLLRPQRVQAALREAYQNDMALHADLRALAEAAEVELLRNPQHSAALHDAPLQRLQLQRESDERSATLPLRALGDARRELPADEWDRLLQALSAAAEVELPWADTRAAVAGSMRPLLRETADGFELLQLDRVDTDAPEGDSLQLRRWFWPKQSFDDWWAQESKHWPATLPAVQRDASLQLPKIPTLRARLGTQDAWLPLPLPTAAPTARRFHSAVWTGSEMIVWGGYQADGLDASDGGRYDPATDTWSPLNLSGAPGARNRHTAIWTGSRMLVWGGGFFLGVLGDGGSYNPATNSWSAIATGGAAPQGRSAHAAVWTGSRMLIWGGQVEQSFGSYAPTASGASYNPTNNTWTTINSTGAPSARADHAYAWSGSQLLIWGGWDGAATLGDGARLDLQTNTWTPMSSSGAPSPRAAASATWTGTSLIVFGGGSGIALGDGARYDPASNTWAPLASTNAPSPRLRHTAVWAGDQLIVWGGFNLSATLADGARYSAASNSWMPIAASGSPSQRQHHSAVWTGSEMIVWGGSRDNGSGGSGNLDSGGRFSLSGGWRPTRISSLQPSGREGHSAVWTGNEMIVWGGRGATTWATDGSRYEPATGDWRLTRTDGAPSGRRLHSAVWTGSQMLIWDGAGGGGNGAAYSTQTDTWTALPNTTLMPAFGGFQTAVWSGNEMIVVGTAGSPEITAAARYRPATQTWVPVTDAGAPSPRYLATAVWLSGRMLIWGGTANFFNTLQTGALYNPATNTWTPIALDGAPSARAGHIAVSADERMYIWGGQESAVSSFRLRSGAFYTPANNTWTAIDSVQAPEARSSAAGVWTGTELLVWGGDTGPADLASGGRYERQFNQWLSTPLAGAPTARRFHTAVWTGELMLVFGGRSSANWLSNLGVYAPYLELPDALFANGFEAD